MSVFKYFTKIDIAREVCEGHAPVEVWLSECSVGDRTKDIPKIERPRALSR